MRRFWLHCFGMTHFQRAVPVFLTLFFLCLQPALAQSGALRLPLEQATKSEHAQSVAQDIASAGRIRMQSQRLAKLYLLNGLGVTGTATVRQLALASKEIDGDFLRLARYAKKQRLQRTFGRCQEVWLELKEALQHPHAGRGAERVSQLSDELMMHAGKLAGLIETEADTTVGRLLDQSSRISMLSQRLANLYLQVQSGNKSQGLLLDIDQARKEFLVGLNELEIAPENSSATREALVLAKGQWIFFDNAIAQLRQPGKADGKAIQHVASSSERIAQVLDVVTMQYLRDFAESPRLPK